MTVTVPPNPPYPDKYRERRHRHPHDTLTPTVEQWDRWWEINLRHRAELVTNRPGSDG